MPREIPGWGVCGLTADNGWWLSTSEWPKADVRNVLVPYAERLKTLSKSPEKFYKA